MNQTIKVNEKFELNENKTILACSGCKKGENLIGREFELTSDSGVKQTLKIDAEVNMRNQSRNLDCRAFEIRGPVSLTQKEIKNRNWYLVPITSKT